MEILKRVIIWLTNFSRGVSEITTIFGKEEYLTLLVSIMREMKNYQETDSTLLCICCTV